MRLRSDPSSELLVAVAKAPLQQFAQTPLRTQERFDDYDGSVLPHERRLSFNSIVKIRHDTLAARLPNRVRNVGVKLRHGIVISF